MTFSREKSIIVFRMEIMNDTAPEASPILPDMQDANCVVGVKQLKKALRDGRALQVFLARNADPKLTDDVVRLCDQCRVPFTWVANMDDLGRACGISVGAAAAATVRF